MEFQKNKVDQKLTYVMPTKLNPSLLEEFSADVKSELDGVLELDLDFKDLEYISSSVVRLLIDLHLSLEEKGGKLRIHNPNEEVEEVFVMTGLDKTFNVIK